VLAHTDTHKDAAYISQSLTIVTAPSPDEPPWRAMKFPIAFFARSILPRVALPAVSGAISPTLETAVCPDSPEITASNERCAAHQKCTVSDFQVAAHCGSVLHAQPNSPCH